MPSTNESTHTFFYSADSDMTLLTQKTDGILTKKSTIDAQTLNNLNSDTLIQGDYRGTLSSDLHNSKLDRMELKLNLMMQLLND